jgi:tripartite-type tricarboxylate transporter receptor subunit TctC
MRLFSDFARRAFASAGRCAAAMSVAAGAVLIAAAAHADSATDEAAAYFKGKDITIYIGYSPGGNYDLYGRLVAKHMSRHMPGHPNFIPKNMPGAGSLRLAKYIYTAAPKDGTVIGIVARGIPFAPLFGIAGADYDPTKFNWLGSTNDEVSVCAFAHRAGITDWKMLRTKAASVGSTGPASDNEQYPKIINAIFHTKMRIVSGYPGGKDVDLAIERGEVDGRCSWSWSSIKAGHYDLVKNGQLDIVLQLALSKHPDLPNVPLITDIAENDQDRALLEAVFARQRLAWPFVAPPGLEPGRVKVLRDAFEATLRDPAYLAEADKINLEHVLVRGDVIEDLINRTYKLPKASVERLRAILK